MPSKYPAIDIEKIRTVSIADRSSSVNPSLFAGLYKPGGTMKDFLRDLPKILKGKDFLALVEAIISAKNWSKPVIWMLGAHVIKCGLTPVLIDLVRKGWVSHIAMNGAGVIHDVELAMWGHTSEDVAENLRDGSFGMVKETADFINSAVQAGRQESIGLGEAIGKALGNAPAENPDHSIFLACYTENVPITVHVGIGTEVVHQHPSADGAAIGDCSLRDFRILCETLTGIGDGGVALNVGSAVILPEVFLKALTVARNVSGAAQRIITANFDMYPHYRPTVNVVERPTAEEGKGYTFIGHHELMIPLLAAAIVELAANG